MKRFILFIIISFISLLTLSVWAMPARHIQKNVTQPDGTQLKLTLVGDEYYHCLVTEEGVTVQLDTTTGFYLPVDSVTMEKALARSSRRRIKVNESRSARLRCSSSMAEDVPQNIGERHPVSGNKKGLVILVNFSDLKMKVSTEEFDDQFNEKGYSKNNHIGSVKDYFYDQSYGKLSIDFDVVGPVTLSQGYAHYGQNDEEGTDVGAGEMVAEACQLADPLVDYSIYDWDGDGKVDQVFVLYAGYGESNYASENTIWPHEYNLYSANYYGDGPGPLYLDEVWIDTYACSYELEGYSGNNMAVIGSACHEFAHCLGLLDAYDTDKAKNGVTTGMSNWSLMDAGSYNGPKGKGAVPAGLTAYERWIAGWLELEELTTPCAVEEMPNLLDEPRAYIIYNEGNRCEAYILENRQNKSWFTYPSKAHGLLIYHIDYDEEIWAKDKVNCVSTHPRYTVIPASGTFGQKGQTSYNPTESQLCGHTWPGSTNNRALTDTSKPAASLFQMNLDRSYKMGKPIEEITEANGKISFLFCGGYELDVPHISTPVGVKEGKALLTWNSVEEASYYELKITDPSASSAILLEESMDKFVTSSVSSENIASKLDQYMSTSGWTGKLVYQGPDGAKLGSSSYAGSLVSPALNVDGSITVTVTLSKVNEKDISTGFLKLSKSASQTSSDYLLSSACFTLSDNQQTFQLSNATNPCYLHILPGLRAYVRNLKIESGASSYVEQIVGDIKDTQYELALEEGRSYSVMIRSGKGNCKSDWSEAVLLSQESAIEQLPVQESSIQQTYDLLGRPINDFSHGMFIRQGKITIQRY